MAMTPPACLSQVTGTDFKAMVPIADILLPPAETSGM